MKFRISETPNPNLWPLGKRLTLEEAAQLLENDLVEMALRSRMASAMEDQGFRFEIERESGDWTPSEF